MGHSKSQYLGRFLGQERCRKESLRLGDTRTWVVPTLPPTFTSPAAPLLCTLAFHL